MEIISICKLYTLIKEIIWTFKRIDGMANNDAQNRMIPFLQERLLIIKTITKKTIRNILINTAIYALFL